MEVASLISSANTFLKQRDEDQFRQRIGAQGAPMVQLTAWQWFYIIFGLVSLLTAIGMGLYVWITGYFDASAAFSAGAPLKGILFILGNTFLPLFYNLYRAMVGGGVFPYRPLPL